MILGKIITPIDIACGVILIAMALMAATARGHGNAAWIDAGGYVNASGTKCCGERDCGIVPDGAAWEVSIGGQIAVQLPNRAAVVTINRIYTAAGPDGHSWACTTGCMFRVPGL